MCTAQNITFDRAIKLCAVQIRDSENGQFYGQWAPYEIFLISETF